MAKKGNDFRVTMDDLNNIQSLNLLTRDVVVKLLGEDSLPDRQRKVLNAALCRLCAIEDIISDIRDYNLPF